MIAWAGGGAGPAAKSSKLSAAMSLARLWRDQGKVQRARELLAPVYGWFAEGFDTRGRKAARNRSAAHRVFDAALDQLGDGQLLEGWYRTLGAGDAMAAPGVAGV